MLVGVGTLARQAYRWLTPEPLGDGPRRQACSGKESENRAPPPGAVATRTVP
jgi:hypothetical protein